MTDFFVRCYRILSLYYSHITNVFGIRLSVYYRDTSCNHDLCFLSPLTAKFWHITDFHYDPLVESEKRSCVVTVDDMPEWGSEFCDSNLKLVKSAIESMKLIAGDAEFILWTG